LDEVKLTAKKHDLELFAIHADVGSLPGENEVTSMITMFDVASKLSIPVVTIRTWGKPDDEEDTHHIFKYIKKLTKEAENRGVTLAVGPHTGGAIYNTEKLLPLLDEISSPSLGVNIDPKELFRAGDDPSETILKVRKRIVHVNFRDYPEEREPIAPADEQIPGRGVIDFPKTLRALKDVGYDKDVNLVIIGAFTYPLSRQMGIAGEARGFLNRCLQELE
jgi:sugar phosphate isomerase/epimerase